MTKRLTNKEVIEYQKARCRDNIEFHKKDVMLLGFVSFIFVTCGFIYAQKKNVRVPLVSAPCAAYSLSKLKKSEIKRRHWKEILHGLERE